ncbi:formimidoyltetrahydrofolate cyclodeaminase [Amycolatopsis sp. DG1A-15b]|uniref:formimidoyltetrahydrofolate cyclodeaminase n=1 Tax=Amycolatopsis sp. DG1A-15b TaxID=3052846 RepID=UPI00255B6127|nr:formimidoyltetrahydrofolate cyclodeaminase [Amycolatopsis sp. DG1A-15b]WIX84941.1 formimidoyltetrahydrofolate cyclodeaminase [Amycolatopsis sp. DG1A-15b]
MRDQIMSDYLRALASEGSPGGGATAALHVAQAAALVGKVSADGREAGALSMHALRLAEKEAHAAAVLTRAHRLPPGEARESAVAEARRHACEPAAEVIAAAAAVLDLAERVLPGRRVGTDLAAVAEAARAAAVTAGVSVEVHSGVPVPPEVAAVRERADRLTATIRKAVVPA